MTQARRAWALRLAAAAAAGAVLVALPGEPTREPTASTSETTTPASPVAPARGTPPDAPPRGTEPPDPREGRTKRTRARRVVRRFLSAFIAYQAGTLDPSTRRALRASCTPGLARRLLRRPPRAAGSAPPPAQLRRLAVMGPFAGRLKAVARLAYPGAEESLLELAVEERGGRLLVARLYP